MCVNFVQRLVILFCASKLNYFYMFCYLCKRSATKTSNTCSSRWLLGFFDNMFFRECCFHIYIKNCFAIAVVHLRVSGIPGPHGCVGFLSQQNLPHTDRPKFRQADDSSHDVTDFNRNVLPRRESFPHKKSGIDKKWEVGEIDKTLAMNGSAQVFVPQVNPK